MLDRSLGGRYHLFLHFEAGRFLKTMGYDACGKVQKKHSPNPRRQARFEKTICRQCRRFDNGWWSDDVCPRDLIRNT